MTHRIFIGNQSLQDVMETLVSIMLEDQRPESGGNSVTLKKTTANLKEEIKQ